MNIKYIEKILICLFIILSLFLAGCSKNNSYDKINEIKKRGVIFVGTTGDYQPMSYLDKKTNKYVGYDTALTEDLAKSLGVNIKYIPTSWPTLLEDTINKKFDLAICGITITKDRKKYALMSDGYLKNGKTILCRKEDANKYKNLYDLNKPSIHIMENPGGENEKFVRKNLPNATLTIHSRNEEIPDLIAAGKADVMITEIVEAKFYSSKNNKLAAPLSDTPFVGGNIGILIPKENKTLLNYVNKFLERERKSGRLDELVKIYVNIEKHTD